MTLIRIINGTYGYRPLLPNGKRSPYVMPKTSADRPFEVEEEEAKRLVALKVAAYVADNAVATPGDDDAQFADSGNTSGNENGESGHEDGENETPSAGQTTDDQTNEDDEPVYTVDMKVDELRAAMKERGFTVKVGMTKQDMVDALLGSAGAFPEQPPQEVIE